MNRESVSRGGKNALLVVKWMGYVFNLFLKSYQKHWLFQVYIQRKMPRKLSDFRRGYFPWHFVAFFWKSEACFLDLSRRYIYGVRNNQHKGKSTRLAWWTDSTTVAWFVLNCFLLALEVMEHIERKKKKGSNNSLSSKQFKRKITCKNSCSCLLRQWKNGKRNLMNFSQLLVKKKALATANTSFGAINIKRAFKREIRCRR